MPPCLRDTSRVVASVMFCQFDADRYAHGERELCPRSSRVLRTRSMPPPARLFICHCLRSRRADKEKRVRKIRRCAAVIKRYDVKRGVQAASFSRAQAGKSVMRASDGAYASKRAAASDCPRFPRPRAYYIFFHAMMPLPPMTPCR